MEEVFEGGMKLPLVEDFYTIQGEGYHVGQAAYFIRLGGCDIGCSWCDAKFTWNRHLHPVVSTDEIIKRALSYPARSVVVTGGEPSAYPLGYLCDNLQKRSVETFVETSGAYPLTGTWNWICLSPKKQTPPRDEIYRKADELKVIVFDDSDLEWAEKNARLVDDHCRLYLQPEWSKYETIVSMVVDYVKNNPKWKISLQTHKFMHIP